ncbi:MAG: ABC transporter substrate-binding protein [Nitrosopumilaceae archaeon]|nr:ABC transporter substrate-binding protein [Nitrosopumilaceae archaeon]
MKLLLVFMLALGILVCGINETFAEKNTFFESVKFIQYLDENTALEEVRNGNLDMYFYRIPADRLENSKSREGLNVFDSASGSYSILVNPAKGDKFNPFSITENRFAIHYMVDRKLIVNELMSGFGAPMFSNYGPFDPPYLTIIEELESFNFRYNPALAEEIISQNLKEAGAIKKEKKWYKDDVPIEVTIFIRSDDPVRKSIGEILSSELERIGFTVKKDFGDLNKAFVVVYGSNPANLDWNLYTEGWNKSAFVRYDSVGLGQMCSPWFSNMPGFNDPSYWNYQNDYIDEISQKIYVGNFSSSEERDKLIKEGTVECINESVRIFLASKVDQYVVNERIKGVVNDFGAGIPSRFTPINAQGEKEQLVVGVKQIYQGAWNPVMGFSDSYSRQIWNILSDPFSFPHPFTGEIMPIRGNWTVETAGPNGTMEIPDDAIIWSPENQRWVEIAANSTSISKVTFDLEFSNWHNGQKMDMNDVLHSLYFTIEWGTQTDENDKTFDTEFTPRAAQSVQTLIGVKPLDDDTIEVYVDFWHFDDGEIAEWASLWNTMPWEIYSSIEQAVIDGKVAISRSGSSSKGINWISLIIPNDAKIIKEYLDEFKTNQYIPAAFNGMEKDPEYFDTRYSASSNWIEKNKHAIISNGPFYLDSYSPEARTISVKTFSDESYPFRSGHWSEFENTQFPKITSLQVPKILSRGEELKIDIETSQADSILYFLNSNSGELVSSEQILIGGKSTQIIIPDELINKLGSGANDLKIFAISEAVLKPDFHSTSFLIVDDETIFPQTTPEEIQFIDTEQTIIWIAIPIIVLVVGIIIWIKKRRN